MIDQTTAAPQSPPSGESAATAATPAPTFTMLGAPDAVACEGDACLLPVH